MTHMFFLGRNFVYGLFLYTLTPKKNFKKPKDLFKKRSFFPALLQIVILKCMY